jgi:alpha-L-fucosidase
MLQQWFTDAKLGIFIHYGIYAVKGIPESWAFFNEQISYEDYMAQCKGFTASKYDPMAWAALFKRAGARYAVMTSKHHDGVALWNTKQSDLSVVKNTPARRDLLTPYCEALRAEGLKVGVYFSHLDWSHPDYAPMPLGRRTKSTIVKGVEWGSPDSERWQRFIKFHRAQLEEICTQFGQIDLLWFDGDWTPAKNDYWRMDVLREQLLKWQPDTILNSRMRGFGDYPTPEQQVPIVAPDKPWELCETINDSWGWQPQDRNYKSVRQIVRTLAECIGMGGNLLLDVGPREDGTIPEEQVERLEALGKWAHRHAEAIYGTVAGLPAGHVFGTSTLSKDRQTVYVFYFDRPWESLAVKGIRNKVRRVSVVGSGCELRHKRIGGAAWLKVPGVLWIDLPESELDSNATVIKIELEGGLDLYHGFDSN